MEILTIPMVAYLVIDRQWTLALLQRGTLEMSSTHGAHTGIFDEYGKRLDLSLLASRKNGLQWFL